MKEHYHWRGCRTYSCRYGVRNGKLWILSENTGISSHSLELTSVIPIGILTMIGTIFPNSTAVDMGPLYQTVMYHSLRKRRHIFLPLYLSTCIVDQEISHPSSLFILHPAIILRLDLVKLQALQYREQHCSHHMAVSRHFTEYPYQLSLEGRIDWRNLGPAYFTSARLICLKHGGLLTPQSTLGITLSVIVYNAVNQNCGLYFPFTFHRLIYCGAEMSFIY